MPNLTFSTRSQNNNKKHVHSAKIEVWRGQKSKKIFVWRCLGGSWRVLGGPWRDFGTFFCETLGRTWAHHGIFLSRHGIIWARRRGNWVKNLTFFFKKQRKTKKIKECQKKHVYSIKIEVWRGRKSKKIVVWRRFITTSLCNNMDLVALRLFCALLSFRRNFRNAEA